MSLDLSNNPKTREVYSLMFIVDMEKRKKKNINKGSWEHGTAVPLAAQAVLPH